MIPPHTRANHNVLSRAELPDAATARDPLSRVVSYLVPGADQHTFATNQDWMKTDDVVMVNKANREQYVKDRIHFDTNFIVGPQYKAFAAGFFKCVKRRAVSMFQPKSLALLVEGQRHINVEELKSIAEYEGFERYEEIIRDFWSVVKEFSQEQLRHLLKFVTASERIPAAGIKSMKFVIQKNGVGDDEESKKVCRSGLE